MDDEDYKDVCFCPENNKLYAVRTNSSSNVSKVDIICPNKTTETQSPEASITVANNANIILYHPTTRTIIVIAPSSVQTINLKDNSVLSRTYTQITGPQCAVFNPYDGHVYIGCTAPVSILKCSPPKLSYSGIDGLGAGANFTKVMNPSQKGFTAISGMAFDPEQNRLCLFDGEQRYSDGRSYAKNERSFNIM